MIADILLRPFRNAIVLRDYARLASRAAAFRLRFLAAFVTGVVVLIVAGKALDEGAPDDSIGLYLHGAFCACTATFLFLQAAVETSLVVPAERATGSLTVLLAAPVPAASLARGILVSRVLSSMLTFLAVLPLEGAALTFGGIGTKHLLAAIGLGLYAAILGASCGLIAGVGADTFRTALGRTLALVVTLFAGVPCGLYLVSLLFGVPSGTGPMADCFAKAGGVAFAAGPVGATLWWGFSEAIPGPVFGALDGRLFLLAPATLAVGMGAAAVLLGSRRLAAEGEHVAGNRGRWKERAAAALERAGGLATRAKRRRGPGVHPLLWRECLPPDSAMSRIASRGLHVVVFGGAAWLLFDPRLRVPGPPDGWFFDILLSIPVFLGALIALAAGTLVAEEREKGALDVLRTTPLALGEIAAARAAGGAWRLRWIFGASGIALAIAASMGRAHPLTFPVVLAGAGSCAIFVSAVSARLGISSPSVRGAAVRTAIFLAAATVGLLLVTILLAVLTNEEESLLVIAASPFVAPTAPLALLVELLEDRHGYAIRGRDLLFPLGGTIACGLFAAAGIVLWNRMPGHLARALQAREDSARS